MNDENFEQPTCGSIPVEIIVSAYADVIRDLMRAVSAGDRNWTLYQAATRMKEVAELLQQSPDPIIWPRIFYAAVEEIQNSIPDDPYHHPYIHAAKRGTKYLVEISATDSAAGGRAARRRKEFRTAIRRCE